MTELSPLDAARFAFRKRGPRLVLTRIAIAYFGLAVLLGVAVFVSMLPILQDMIGWYFGALREIAHGGEPALPQHAERWIALAPIAVAVSMAGWILFAAFEAACLRWLAAGKHGGGVLGLNFGADTWRVFAIYWLWVLAGAAAIVLIALIYWGLRTLSTLHPIVGLVVMLIAALAPLALFAAFVFVGVRLAPAAAVTVARERFAIGDAWALTRGKFWPLLGAFIIAAVAYLIVATIGGEIVRIPIAGVLQPLLHDLIRGGGDPAEIIERLKTVMFTPVYIAVFVAYAVLAKVVATVFYIAWFGINASVVAGEGPAAAGPGEQGVTPASP